MRPIPEHRISTKALKVWSITAAIVFFILWVMYCGFLYITARFELPIWMAVATGVTLLVGTVLFVFVFPNVKWRRWRYQVYEHEVDLQRGVLLVKRTLIPMVRVQHVDTVQGPLLRKYGLATVTISTAATVHEIPALVLEEADQLRDRISELARVADEDV